MSTAEVDAYIQAQPQPQRDALEHLRTQILRVIPEATQCISYGMPGFKVHGKVVAGFAGYKNHIGYYPHSGNIIPLLSSELEGYVVSGKSGGVQFPVDSPVPDELISQLITLRIKEVLGIT